MRCDYCGWNNLDGAERCVKCNQILPEEISEPEVVVEAPVQGVEKATPYADPRATVVFQNDISANNSVENTSSDCFCPECGYPFGDDGVTECANCGFILKPVEQVSAPATEPVVAPANHPMQQTVRDFGAHHSQKSQEASPNTPNPVVDFKRTIMDAGVATTFNKQAMKQTVRDLNTVDIPQVEPQASQIEEKHRLLPVDNFDGKSDAIILESPTTLNRANVDPENPTIDAAGHASIEQRDGEWYIKSISSTQHVYISTSRELKLEQGDIVVLGNKKFIFQ